MKNRICEKRYALLNAVREATIELGNYEPYTTLYSLISTDYIRYPAHSIDNPSRISYADKPEYRLDYKRRKITSLGRFIRRNYKVEISDAELDLFCAKVMSKLSYNENDWEILVGDDIIEAYECCIGGHSCMTGSSSCYVEIYAVNPDVVSLLVYQRKARALLWQTIEGPVVMDRIYPNDGYHIENYMIYAKKHDIVMRKHDGLPSGDEYDENYTVVMKLGPNEYVPYMDSFRYCTVHGNTIKLTTGKRDCDAVLNNTDGSLYPNVCANCGEAISDGDAMYDTADGIYCMDCAAYCCSCDEVYLMSNMTIMTNGDCVCDYCLEQYYTECDNCGEYEYNGDVTDTEDGYAYCSECVEDFTFECEECGKIFSNEEANRIGDRSVCDSCYEEYDECDGCKEIFRKDELENWLCEYCRVECSKCGDYILQELAETIDDSFVCKDCYEEYEYEHN